MKHVSFFLIFAFCIGTFAAVMGAQTPPKKKASGRVKPTPKPSDPLPRVPAGLDDEDPEEAVAERALKPAIDVGMSWSYSISSLDKSINGKTLTVTLSKKDSYGLVFQVTSGTSELKTVEISSRDQPWFVPIETESGEFSIEGIGPFAPRFLAPGKRQNSTRTTTDYAILNGSPVPSKRVSFGVTDLGRAACVVPAGKFSCTETTTKQQSGILVSQTWFSASTSSALFHQTRRTKPNSGMITFKLVSTRSPERSAAAPATLLRFDGLYRQRIPEVGTGGTYRQHFRFYLDGDCLSVSVVADAEAEKIATWFNRDRGEIGKSKLSGDRLSCTFNQPRKWTYSALLNAKGFRLVDSNGPISEEEYDFILVAFPPERVRMDKMPPTAGNRDPVFPMPIKLEINTNLEYDTVGRLMGGVTTIELKTPATDSDGDQITYEWSGRDVIHTEANATTRSIIESEGLKATWRRIILMGELASAFLTLTAYDGKGGKAVHKFCVGNRVMC